MDNANPTMQPPIVNTPQTTVPPQQSVPQVPVSELPSGDSKKMILWLVIGLVVVILLVGGIYFLLNQQQTGKSAQQASEQKVIESTPDTMDALERDLNALNVEDTETDFTSIDQDLQQL